MPKRTKVKRKRLILKATVIHHATGKIERDKYERIPGAIVDEARRLVHAGWSKSQIARNLKMSRGAVQNLTRDISSATAPARARADLVRTLMERYKDFFRLMVRLHVLPSDLDRIARWVREKAAKSDDSTLETLVDDRISFIEWFSEVLERDSDFFDRYPRLQGMVLAVRGEETSLRIPGICKVTLTQPSDDERLGLPAPNDVDSAEEPG